MSSYYTIRLKVHIIIYIRYMEYFDIFALLKKQTKKALIDSTYTLTSGKETISDY